MFTKFWSLICISNSTLYIYQIVLDVADILLGITQGIKRWLDFWIYIVIKVHSILHT